MKNTLLTERFQELAGIKPLHEKSFPDLTGDGNVTYADVLKGRGVDLDYSEVSEEEDMCEACGMAHEGSCGMEETDKANEMLERIKGFFETLK